MITRGNKLLRNWLLSLFQVERPDVQPFTPPELADVTYGPSRKLYISMQVTARARFAASARLSNTDRQLTTLTAMTSAYLIIFTVAPYVLHLSAEKSDTLNMLTIALTIIILVSSLLQYSSAGAVLAEQHHRAALEINELIRNILSLGPAIDTESHARILNKYNVILQKYSLNHDNIDFLSVRIERKNEYPWDTNGDRRKMAVEIFISTFLPTAFLWIVTLSFLGIVFLYVLPTDWIHAFWSQ